MAGKGMMPMALSHKTRWAPTRSTTRPQAGSSTMRASKAAQTNTT